MWMGWGGKWSGELGWVESGRVGVVLSVLVGGGLLCCCAAVLLNCCVAVLVSSQCCCCVAADLLRVVVAMLDLQQPHIASVH